MLTRAIAEYQYFAKAPYSDIKYLPYKYLFDALEIFSELHQKFLNSIASIFVGPVENDNLNEKLTALKD